MFMSGVCYIVSVPSRSRYGVQHTATGLRAAGFHVECCTLCADMMVDAPIVTHGPDVLAECGYADECHLFIVTNTR